MLALSYYLAVGIIQTLLLDLRQLHSSQLFLVVTRNQRSVASR
jgi:hypothetical protein